MEVCKSNKSKLVQVYPAVPKYSTTYRLRMGETTIYEKPFPMSMTLVKKDTRTIVLDGTFGGVKSHLETTYSSEGMSVVGDIEGHEYSSFWTRQEPEVRQGFSVMIKQMCFIIKLWLGS